MAWQLKRGVIDRLASQQHQDEVWQQIVEDAAELRWEAFVDFMVALASELDPERSPAQPGEEVDPYLRNPHLESPPDIHDQQGDRA